MIPALVFRELFGCDESLYAAWGFGSYDNFVETLVYRLIEDKSFHYYLYEEESTSSFSLGISLLFCFLFVLVAAIITIWYFQPSWFTEMTSLTSKY